MIPRSSARMHFGQGSTQQEDDDDAVTHVPALKSWQENMATHTSKHSSAEAAHCMYNVVFQQESCPFPKTRQQT